MTDIDVINAYRSFLLELEPLETISHLALGALLSNPEHPQQDKAMEYVVLEMVAAFYSSSPLNSTCRRPTPDDDQKIKEEGSRIIESHLHKYFDTTKRSLDPDKQKEDSIVIRSLLYHLMVRIEGYPNQMWNAAEEEFSPHDSYLKAKLGFDAKTAVAIFKHIFTMIDKQINAHFSEFASLMSESIQIQKDWNEGKLTNDEMLRKAKAIEETTSLNLDKHNEKAKLIFTLHIKDLDAIFQTEIVRNFLARFARRFGDINTQYETPLNFNELYARPILLVADDKVFVPLMPLLAEVPVKTLHYDLIKDQNYEPVYSKLKSDYYETKTVQYLSKIFGRKNVYPSLHYGPNNEYETDVLVHFDDRILIFECKSKTLTLPARQGSYGTILNDFKLAIQNSFDQARRTRDYITSSDIAKFKDTSEQIVEIRREDISRIYLICVTADTFGGLGSNLTELLKKDVQDDFPWVISIRELELIAEYLNSPYHFLHFLGKRIRYHGKVFSADEMDYVGCYLSQGLYFEDELKKHTLIIIDGFTEEFDKDQWRKMGHNITAKIGTSWSNPAFNNLIGTLAIFGGKRHTSAIEMLLDLGSDMRDKLIDVIGTTITRTLNDKQIHDVTLPFDDFGISFMSKVGRHGLQNMNVNQSILKKYKHRKDRWLGLARDVTDSDYLVNEFAYVESKWEFDKQLEKVVEKMRGNKLPI